MAAVGTARITLTAKSRAEHSGIPLRSHLAPGEIGALYDDCSSSRAHQKHNMAFTQSSLKDSELAQLYKTLLTAACLSCPHDPIQFLKNTLTVFQGHDNLQDVDWHRFFRAAELQSETACMPRSKDDGYMDPNDIMQAFYLFEKACSSYRRHLTSTCFRKWKIFTQQQKRDTTEQAQKANMTKKHFERKCLRAALHKWLNQVKLDKKTRAAAIQKLEAVLEFGRHKRIIAEWRNAVKDSKRTKEYFKKMTRAGGDQQPGEGCDGLSVLPLRLSLKIFQYLELRDWLSCAEVCCTWKSIIQSGALWSKINVSVDRDWISDSTMMKVLQTYRPFVIHLNLRCCTSLKWPSLQCISECSNLQELNVSECLNVTDMMIEKITEGCPYLLYLNLSSTLVTNKTLRELSRNCVNLQYLSLAYCNRFTDEGFLYLNTGKGCHNLVHLNLSGCTQMTVNGFRYISAGCPSLREIIINDMPTLSDSCVLALIANYRSLSVISLLDAPHLSDMALKAIAAVAKLQAFSIEGNQQLSDVSWKALCSSSRGLRRLHAVQCPRMTDASLKSIASLPNLQYLDVSLCSKLSDIGIRFLTDGCSATKIQVLNVSYCSHISDVSVMGIAQRLSKLYHLNLSYCERLTDVALELLSGSSICSLDISGCHIQDQGLAALERIHLKKLVLAECVSITDFGIETLCQHAKDLEYIDVSYCVALSDLAIRSLSFYCRGLVSVRMSGCVQMTDMAVQYLTSGALCLRELDVSGCVLLTDDVLTYFESVCPPLCSITISGCTSISTVAALKLQPYIHWAYQD